MILAATACLSRIIFFRIFAYTRFRYFEFIFAALSMLVYLMGNLLLQYGWEGWTFPLPVIAFSTYFSWGILKDQSQLLANVRGGYKVKVGQPASDFSLPDQDGNTVQLSAFKDKRHVLIIFVRGDWCPGCHMMLRTYEKNNEKFKEKNIMVMAIGPDPVGVNKNMVEKLGLEFRVLADEAQRTAMTYGVQIREYENVMAEKYKEGIPLPASFLIDKHGIVRYVSRPDKVGEFLNPSLIFPIVEKLN
jgi:peroxiredoxin